MASMMPCIDAFTRPVTPKNGLLVVGTKKEIRNPMIPQQFAKLVNDDDEESTDVDAFSLTTLGFGLIAFNFLVLANVSFVLC